MILTDYRPVVLQLSYSPRIYHISMQRKNPRTVAALGFALGGGKGTRTPDPLRVENQSIRSKH